MNEMPDSLLAADEPAPVTVYNENGRSPFLIVADHAGNSLPRALGRLGVSETELGRHIGLGHRHRCGQPPCGRRARRYPGYAELLTPRYRLQSQARIGDINSGN